MPGSRRQSAPGHVKAETKCDSLGQKVRRYKYWSYWKKLRLNLQEEARRLDGRMGTQERQ